MKKRSFSSDPDRPIPPESGPQAKDGVRGHLRSMGWLGALVLAAAIWQWTAIGQPSTMDACYYLSGGLRIAHGEGWSEPFVWNYLDNSTTIPHEGFSYWMPFPSIIAALGIRLIGDTFAGGRLLFFLLSIAFPFFVFGITWIWTRREKTAGIAGSLAVLPGLFSVYWTATDSFILMAWMGGAMLAWMAGPASRRSLWWAGIIGLLAGLLHLTRADGVLYAFLVVFYIAIGRWEKKAAVLTVFLSGYLLAMSGWFIRNIVEYGSFFSPAAGRALWLRTYNDLFLFPGATLTPQYWWSQGWTAIAEARGVALIWNVQTIIFATGLLFLAPFCLWGSAKLRKNPAVIFGWIFLAVEFCVMTFVFPFQGSRGGLFHSSAGLLLLVCVSAAVGIERASEWIISRANWKKPVTSGWFAAGIVAIYLFASSAVFFQRAVDISSASPDIQKIAGYRAAVGALRQVDTSATNPIVMVGNPPCFFVQTGLRGVAVPNGDLRQLRMVTDAFEVEYLLLDQDLPEALLGFYQSGNSNTFLELIAEIPGRDPTFPMRLYRVATREAGN